MSTTYEGFTGWAYASTIRALKTAGETAGAMIPLDALLWELHWSRIIGVTATAALLSFIWSLRGLPEVTIVKIDKNIDE